MRPTGQTAAVIALSYAATSGLVNAGISTPDYTSQEWSATTGSSMTVQQPLFFENPAEPLHDARRTVDHGHDKQLDDVLGSDSEVRWRCYDLS